jgi:hypothetical protein
MQTVIDILVILAVVYVAIDAIRAFTSAAGNVWQRLWAAARHSATVLWARFVVVLAAGADALIWLADVLGAPSVAGAIQQYLQPSYVAALMIGIAFISELARRRRGSATPTS